MALDMKGMSAKSSSNSSEERSIELLSPNVQTKASTSCIVVSYSLANFTALSESRKQSTKARQKVITILGFLCQRRKLYGHGEDLLRLHILSSLLFAAYAKARAISRLNSMSSTATPILPNTHLEDGLSHSRGYSTKSLSKYRSYSIMSR